MQTYFWESVSIVFSKRRESGLEGSELVREGGMADTKRGRGRETRGMLVDLAHFTAS